MKEVMSAQPDINDESSSSTLVSRDSSRQSNETTLDKVESDDIVEATYGNLKKQDEFDAVGAIVAFKLRRMDEHQRNIAEHLINNVLYLGLKNELNEVTYAGFPQKNNENNFNVHYNIPSTVAMQGV